MLKKLALVPLILSSVMFAGCDDDDVNSLAKGISQAFGVSVQVQAANDDTCLYRQLSKFKQDYDALNKPSQQLVRERAKAKFKQIVLNPTKLAQVIQGEVTVIVYYTRSCGNNQCWNTRVAHKAIGDERKYDGAAPITQLEKGETLAVTAQAGRDESLRKDYWTASVAVYDRADSVKDRSFIEGRQNGSIWLNREDATPETTCGRVVNLSDVVGGEGLVQAPRSGS